MKNQFFSLVLAGCVCLGLAQAQYIPSRSQQAQLTRQTEKLLNLQKQFLKTQATIAFELAKRTEMCRAIALANHWPATVECSPENLTFSDQATAQRGAASFAPGPAHSAPQPPAPAPVVSSPSEVKK